MLDFILYLFFLLKTFYNKQVEIIYKGFINFHFRFYLSYVYFFILTLFNFSTIDKIFLTAIRQSGLLFKELNKFFYSALAL